MRQRSWWDTVLEQIGALGMYRKIFFNESRLSVPHLSQTHNDTICQKYQHQSYHWCFKRYGGATDMHHINISHSGERF